MTAERWAELYRLEFPRIYRALLAVLRDRERALDALHDAFVAGLRQPPAHDADLAGWLFVVAVRSTRRFRRLPLLPLEWVTGTSGDDEIEAALDRMEVGRLLAGLTERQRAMVGTPPPVGPSASCEPPAFGANGRCLTLVPNLFRSEAFGYNLVIPGDWREVPMPAGTHPYVIGQPNAGPALTAPFLLDRHVFTARPPQEWSGTAPGILAPAGDLDVP